MADAPTPSRRSVRVAFAIAAIAAGYLVAESWAPQPQLDDSFITYRYAQNLVSDAGLVWNPGERVEGITNLLWTLLVAGGMAVGAPAPAVGHVLGMLCGAALLLATASLASVGVPARYRPIAALSSWVVLASPALPYFATSGMETHGFLAIVVAALAAHGHGRMRLATTLLCLGIAVRPDAGIVAASVLGTQLLQSGLRRPSHWLPLAAFVATVLGLTAFRLAYYGSPIPNTFYAKVGGIPLPMALAAAGRFLFESPVCLVLPAALALRGDRRALAPLAACLATLLYVVASGGTAMTFSRFLLPIFPILAALAARTAARAVAEQQRLAPLWLACLVASAAGYLGGGAGAMLAAVATGAGLSAIGSRLSWRAPRAAVAALVLAAVAAVAIGSVAGSVSRSQRVRGKRHFDEQLIAKARRSLHRLQASQLPPDSLVGAVAIGVVGYYGNYRILDLLGLTDPVIAHSSDDVRGPVLLGQGHVRSNARYVLGRRPEVLLIGRNPGPQATALTAVRALWESPDLERLYRWDPRIEAYRLRAGQRSRATGG